MTFDFTCDVCGAAINDADSDASVRRSWDGAVYVVDVCAAHRTVPAGVAAQLKGFVDVGHRSAAKGGRRPGAGVSAPAPRVRRAGPAKSAAAGGERRDDLKAVRAWALAEGRKVGDRGRIPADVVAAYDAANTGSAQATPPVETVAAAAPRKRTAAKTSVASGGATPAEAAPRKRRPRPVPAAV